MSYQTRSDTSWRDTYVGFCQYNEDEKMNELNGNDTYVEPSCLWDGESLVRNLDLERTPSRHSDGLAVRVNKRLGGTCSDESEFNFILPIVLAM